MTELDKEIIDTTDIDTIEEPTTGVELTEEDYFKEKARREKAEKTLVELKKQLKEKNANSDTNLSEKELDLRDEMGDFLRDNPELKDYKADLMKYAKTFVSDGDKMQTAIRKAKALVENDDKTIENRKKTNSMNITEGESSNNATYTKSQLAKMSQSAYEKAMGEIEGGKAKLVT